MDDEFESRTALDRLLAFVDAGTIPPPAWIGLGTRLGFESGRRVDDKYELEELIGAGSFGEVWAAREIAIDRDLAIKFLVPEDELSRALFVDDARHMSQVEHANVVGLLTIESDATRAGRPYYVMNRLSGRDLEQRLREGPLDRETLADVSEGLLRALQAAHDAGVSHGDIKPANVFLTDAGQVKLLDFGMAKAEEALTKPNFGGTPRYMSPEQHAGERGLASDVYSAAATIFEAATGHWERRFDASLLPEDFPSRAAEALCEALREDPEERTTTPAQLRDHLVPVLRLRGCDLGHRLRGGPLGFDALVDFSEGLLSALVSAHDADVVHGDIKPANVFLHDGGQVELLGLGSANTANANANGCGTRRYSAPELRDGNPGRASDVYGAAATIFEAATCHWDGSFDATQLPDGFPRRAADALRDALREDPEPRTATAAQLRKGLVPALRRHITWLRWRRPVRRSAAVLAGLMLMSTAASVLWWIFREPESTAWVAYISDESGQPEVWAARADGRRRVRLTNGLADPRLKDDQFEFSGPIASGDRIAVMSDRNAEGERDGRPRLHFVDIGAAPAWSRAQTTLHINYFGLSWDSLGQVLFTNGGVCSEFLDAASSIPMVPAIGLENVDPSITYYRPSARPRDDDVLVLVSRCNNVGGNGLPRVPPQLALLRDRQRVTPLDAFPQDSALSGVWSPDGTRIAVITAKPKGVIAERPYVAPRLFLGFDDPATSIDPPQPDPCRRVGGVTLDDRGWLGNAADFSAGGHVDCGRPPWVGGLSTFTITARVMLTADVSDRSYQHAMVATTSDRPGLDHGFELRIGEMRPTFRLGGAPPTEFTVRGPALEVGAWVDVAVTYDGAQLRLYVDRELVDRNHAAGVVLGDTGSLVIGNTLRTRCRNAADQPEPCRQSFPGLIDELRIYDHALSERDIALGGRVFTPEPGQGVEGLTYGRDAGELWLVLHDEAFEGTLAKLDVATGTLTALDVPALPTKEIGWFETSIDFDEDANGVADVLEE